MTTKNIVPRATGEGSLGTATKKWGNIYADYITLEDGETLQTKIANQNSRITTAEGTVSTLSGDVTSLYGSVDELSDGKVNLSGGTMTGALALVSGSTLNSLTIESIQSSGNNYIRYANGLQICWDRKTVTTAIQNTWGSVYESAGLIEDTRFTFPVSFLNGQYTVMASVADNSAWIERITAGEGGSCAISYLIRPSTTTSKSYTIHYLVIGRWK